MEEDTIRLTEELMLLVLDEQSGFIELSDRWDFACVVAGSVVAWQSRRRTLK